MPSEPPEDGEQEGDDEDEEEAGREPRGLAVPNRRLCPLEVRFSQMRARSTFRDGRALSEALAQIKATPCAAAAEAGCGGAAARADGQAEPEEPATYRLEAPFPPIEVMPWRCKLRDSVTGRPRVDPHTGGELYDPEERLFTLDNRRLCCLQQAAIALWPARVIVDVVELPPGVPSRVRQLKKFRTLSRGQSILICEDAEQAAQRWSWHEAVGLKAESEPEDQHCHVQLRRRPPRGGAPRPSPPSSGQRSRASSSADLWGTSEEALVSEKSWPEVDMSWHGTLTGFLAFAAIYLGVRLVAKVGTILLA